MAWYLIKHRELYLYLTILSRDSVVLWEYESSLDTDTEP
jgi:hypothetical protein